MKRSRKNLLITLTLTFVLMTLLVIFTARVVFRTVFSSVQEIGDDKATAITADLENYLDTAKSVLWVAADTVDHMVAKGATDEEIIEYITRESTRTEEQFDDSYTGLYGVIRGNYVDGVGWVPPEDYDPTTRDWYLTTVGAKGEVVIVSPYVDAQTGNVIISVGKALTDTKNAMAMDLTLNGVQEIVEKIQINGYGYGYIVNSDGMVIAHHDRSENGKNYNDLPEYHELFQQVLEVDKGNFDTKINGEKCTVFVDEVMDQWHLVIITKNSDLYKDPMTLLVASILINLVVFILISVFYLIGYRSERKFNVRMEEMKEIERRKDYEAKVLKLEKSAADSANKAKSDFLADMSHEIRTPINAVLGMNEMILHESKEEATLEYASNIKSAGTTLLSIINTILDFSKIEDGRMSLVPVEFETCELINGLVNSISERAKEKNLEFKMDIDPSIPSRLMGDDVRISQVIMNLLTNAVKYTEKGEVLLTIRSLGMRDEKALLFISVKDTGIGIKKEDINKLAVSFERLDEKRNRHIEGTGLGISIVIKLLDMMHSGLKIKSEYGVGSEFSFELPVDVADPAPMGEWKHVGRGTSKSESRDVSMIAPKARILLTDDNAMNRKVAANLLKLFHITPVLCASGEETIKQMKEHEFDLLLLDHMMPEMDGIETLDRLMRSSLVKSTRVIALTANAVVGAREQYLEAGFHDYLSKPIHIPELEKILRKHLPASLIEEVPEETAEEPTEDTAEEKEAAEEKKALEEVVEEIPLTEAGEEPAPEDASAGPLERLRSIGISVEDGLGFCADDEEFYLEIIHDYIDAAPERIEQLDTLLAGEDMKNYKILVHTIKSASKTIGAMPLFERALDLEQAAAGDQLEYVRQHHDALQKEFQELVNQLKETV